MSHIVMFRMNVQIIEKKLIFIEIRFVSEASPVRHGRTN